MASSKQSSLDNYLRTHNAVKGEGFTLTRFVMSGEELRSYNSDQFVEPDVPFREVRKLYKIIRPNHQRPQR
jgi:hypothetical protein